MNQLERSKPLDDWLEKVNATQLWAVAKKGQDISGYSVNGHLIVTVRHQYGWELLVPASDGNSVSATLDAAAEHCGVK